MSIEFDIVYYEEGAQNFLIRVHKSYIADFAGFQKSRASFWYRALGQFRNAVTFMTQLSHRSCRPEVVSVSATLAHFARPPKKFDPSTFIDAMKL
jgi:hypothetical protein